MDVLNNTNQVIDFMESNNLTSKQICQILHEGYHVIADDAKPPNVLIQEFKEYWDKWKDRPEKPLFLNLDIDVQ